MDGRTKLKTSDFMEDETGAQLSTGRLNEINDVLQLCYVDLLNRAPLPGYGIIEKWGRDAGIMAVNFVAINIYPRFPEFRLCDAGWKLTHYLKQHYPSWKKNREQEMGAIKVEISRPSVPPPVNPPKVRVSFLFHTLLHSHCAPSTKEEVESSSTNTTGSDAKGKRRADGPAAVTGTKRMKANGGL